MSDSTWGIYLNDHLGLMMGEIELAHRVANENEGSPLSVYLSLYADEVTKQKDVVETLLASIGQKPSSLKQAAGWLAEKVGRLKLNDALTRYTDLARVLELEVLMSVAQSRLLLWENVSHHKSLVCPDAAASSEQTSKQLVTLREHYRLAVPLAFEASGM